MISSIPCQILKMLLVAIMIFSHLSPINGETVTCGTSVTKDNEPAEGDNVTYSCATTYNGIYNATLVWYQWYNNQWQQLTYAANPTRGLLGITYIWKAVVPKPTVILRCVLCEMIPGREGCTLTNNTCQTEDYDILYYVRSIAIWPIIFFYASPGKELTCSAQGNPDPEYLWIKSEDGGQWWVSADGDDDYEYSKDKAKVTVELSENITSAIYKCRAKNTIRDIEKVIESAGIKVNAGGVVESLWTTRITIIALLLLFPRSLLRSS